MGFKTCEQLLNICVTKKVHIYNVAIDYEIKRTDLSKQTVIDKMYSNLNTMKNSVKKGLDKNNISSGKIIGGEAKKLKNRYENEKPVCGHTIAQAISFALSTMEVNASMGKIVAAPTAGSCGILPAVFLSLQNSHHISDAQIINGLFTASSIGIIIAHGATLSGAQGGCQAEVGSAASMAAAGVVEIMGGSPEQAVNASAIALKNLMGLVCDPIAGLVEAPCSKRNAIGTANALIAAEMSLSGIESVIPFDEVIEAMYKVGQMLPCSLKETSLGGVAATQTAKKIEKEIFG